MMGNGTQAILVARKKNVVIEQLRKMLYKGHRKVRKAKAVASDAQQHVHHRDETSQNAPQPAVIDPFTTPYPDLGITPQDPDVDMPGPSCNAPDDMEPASPGPSFWVPDRQDGASTSQVPSKEGEIRGFPKASVDDDTDTEYGTEGTSNEGGFDSDDRLGDWDEDGVPIEPWLQGLSAVEILEEEFDREAATLGML
jgi:hypothetical protein